MRKLTFLLLLLLLTGLPARASDEIAAIEAANRQLKSEYELAKKQQIYFVFDLQQNQVQFKSSGIVLATLRASDVRIWGRPSGDQIRLLTKKDALNPPKRENITITPPPGDQQSEEPKKPEPVTTEKSEPKKFELQALELDDMPVHYRLLLSDGLLVTVHPAAESSFSSKMKALAGSAYWYLSRPLISDWHYLHKQPYNELHLVLPVKEARMLYWSFTEGAPCLILWP